MTKVELISGIVLATCIGAAVVTSNQREAEERASVAKAQFETQRLAEENRKLLEERKRNEEKLRQAEEQARLDKQRLADANAAKIGADMAAQAKADRGAYEREQAVRKTRECTEYLLEARKQWLADYRRLGYAPPQPECPRSLRTE